MKGNGGGRPTKGEIVAAQKVLYRRGRLREMKDDVNSISVLMRIAPGSQPGVGPDFIIPATGAPGPGVKESIRRCRKIARNLREIAADLKDVKIPKADRKNLRAMVKEEATAWEIRADAWADPKRPDVEAVVKRISRHMRGAVDAATEVKVYLSDTSTKKESAA